VVVSRAYGVVTNTAAQVIINPTGVALGSRQLWSSPELSANPSRFWRFLDESD